MKETILLVFYHNDKPEQLIEEFMSNHLKISMGKAKDITLH